MYFEKQVKTTLRADNLNSVQKAQKYPCLKLVFNDNWNDYGYYTWFHLWLLNTEDKDKWYGLGDLKIIHKDDGEVYSQIPDAFETLDDNFCSLGINISFYKTLLDCFGNEGAKEILAALKDCSIDATVRERFNTSQSYKVSLLREISTQEVIDDALLLIENEDAGNIFSFGYHFTPPYNTECIADWNVHFDFDAKKYKRVVAIIGENGVGKTQMLSDMLRDLTENNDDKFTHKPLLRNILVLCSSEFDAYQTIKKGNGNYNVRNLSVVQDDYTVDKLAGSILTILDRGTFLAHGDMLAVWQHYMELLKKQIGEEIDDLLIVPPKTEDNPYPKPYLNKKRLEQLVKQFSTGQLQLFTLITHVCAYIHLNSLVVLDEPEIHLHPRLVTDFFSCLGELLFYFGSYALVPTHSPLVIRECVNGNVYLMQRTNDDIVHIGLVPFRTFGQDLTTLYENVFGYEEKRTFYYGVIRSMAKNHRASYKRVVEQLEADGVRLDINSRSIIKEIFLKIEREADE